MNVTEYPERLRLLGIQGTALPVLQSRNWTDYGAELARRAIALAGLDEKPATAPI